MIYLVTRVNSVYNLPKQLGVLSRFTLTYSQLNCHDIWRVTEACTACEVAQLVTHDPVLTLRYMSMLLCMSWLSLVTAGTGRAAGERQRALGSQRICAATGAARLVCEKPKQNQLPLSKSNYTHFCIWLFWPSCSSCLSADAFNRKKTNKTQFSLFSRDTHKKESRIFNILPKKWQLTRRHYVAFKKCQICSLSKDSTVVTNMIK